MTEELRLPKKQKRRKKIVEKKRFIIPESCGGEFSGFLLSGICECVLRRDGVETR